MPRFFFSFGGTKFTHAQCINIMSELDSTRQKFDAWIGVAFLSDSATKPVECAAGNAAADFDVEFLSNLICWIEFDKAEMRRMNWALRNQDILTQDLCLDIYYSSCFVEYPLYPFPCCLPYLRSSIYDQSWIFINIAAVLLSIIVFKSVAAQASQAQSSTLHTWCIESCSEKSPIVKHRHPMRAGVIFLWIKSVWRYRMMLISR